MDRDYVAGIDGGGTKTTMVCQSLTGEILCRLNFGPFNSNSIGEQGLSELLHEITGFLKEQGRCVALCIGAAGSSSPGMRTLVEAAMEQAGIFKWKLAGDHEIALYGALKGAPGCVLVAGTGSICFGRNACGETCRAGGWGHLIGDEGSGYALGRAALTAVSHWYDGYGEATGLTNALTREMSLGSREEIVAYTYGGDKSRIAALSRLVEQEAAAGDRVAEQLLKKNALALALLVEAVAHRLGIANREVALLGGLLTADTILRRTLASCMKRALPDMCCVEAKEPPEIGAAMMAREMLRIKGTEW